jgi:hypothetical protein
MSFWESYSEHLGPKSTKLDNPLVSPNPAVALILQCSLTGSESSSLKPHPRSWEEGFTSLPLPRRVTCPWVPQSLSCFLLGTNQIPKRPR